MKKKIHLTEISIKLWRNQLTNVRVVCAIYYHHRYRDSDRARVISGVTLARSRCRMMRIVSTRVRLRRRRAVVKTIKKEEVIKRQCGSAGLHRQPAHTLRWRGGSACCRPRWSWPPTHSDRCSPGAWSSSSLCAPCARWSCTLHCLRPPSLRSTLFRLLSSRCALS